MKKIVMISAAVLGILSFSACDTKKSGDKEGETVVDRDTVATEYEVTEKVVETDTTTKTKTVDADSAKEDNK
jgi:hypothetical protein